MAYYLASLGDRHSPSNIQRFDPRYWVINFSRPMMSSLTTIGTGTDSMRMDCVFYNKGDLAGLIWESEDTYDHPLLTYETNKDYTGVVLSFRWQSTNLKPLDEPNGPTLTIEGKDEFGADKVWFVRLWNYKTSGTATDAVITLDFDNLDGGYFLPADADRVYPAQIDRFFISLVPNGYVEKDTTPYSSPIEASAVVSDLTCNSFMRLFSANIAPHKFRMATGYDDSYNVTPQRLVENTHSLGYRDWINHYVGMSHYYRLESVGSDLLATGTGGHLNTPCEKWHQDFLERSKAMGYDKIILSLSFELFNENCPPSWRQLDQDGGPALTGWEPPSSLLSPTLPAAQNYLKGVALAFTSLAVAASQDVHFQIGEPWWWVDFRNQVPCFYDPSTTALYTSETGKTAPLIADMKQNMNAAQLDYLDWLGTKLGASTIGLRDAVKTAHPTAKTYLLFYAPQVFGGITPELHRANLPSAWNAPAFDVLQLEDYDFVTEGRSEESDEAAEVVTDQLGYPVEDQHYFSGFVLNKEDAQSFWLLINNAADAAVEREVPEIFYWAYPQIMRDGFTVVGVASSVLRSWTFTQDGHDFYVLRLGDSETIVYDATTQSWSQWGDINYAAWPVTDGASWQGQVWAGGDKDGTLYQVVPGLNTDEGDVPIVAAVRGFVSARMRNEVVPCNSVELTGSLANKIDNLSSVRLRTSDDLGVTWTDHGFVVPRQSGSGLPSAGGTSYFEQEIAWRSIGRIRAPGRIFEILDNGAVLRIDGLDMK